MDRPGSAGWEPSDAQQAQEVLDQVMAAREMPAHRAQEIADSGVWLMWSPEQLARATLRFGRMLSPFDPFARSVDQALGRGVVTHEFGYPWRLLAELDGDDPPDDGIPEWYELIGTGRTVVPPPPPYGRDTPPAAQ